MTYIANKLAEAADRSLFVSNQLDGSKAWAEFAAGSLQVHLHSTTQVGLGWWCCV